MELSPNNVLKRRAAAFPSLPLGIILQDGVSPWPRQLCCALVAASAPLHRGDGPKMLVLDLKPDMVP